MELTNEQLAKVFLIYYGQEVQRPHNDPKTFFWNIEFSLLAITKIVIGKKKYSLTECKLLLTPLSELTDEDAIQVARLIDPEMTEEAEFKEEMKEGKQEFVSALTKQDFEAALTEYPPIRYHFLYQYLIQKGYDVPVFIELGHPANGKTAIELGIAIDKSKNTTHG